ncbi:2Fe-2S ferredoxin [Novimethylophilus kurashikiensis]|uniref:2Fe-2S ferredoxin n=1 Tax=Novimethylophilus kurashikiensis TaxID=1825523 RepID=A0A2R5F7N6_9PROT|nr:(2Fe-2S) ferredoxin domain-containing protein [Novimethylophilus kurashikiensis]GBG13839.1 2Fe-2S ferredoxin [Novimethylophilus kurashikiensis]
MKLVVCTMRRYAPNPHSCGNSGGLDIAEALEKNVAEQGLSVGIERIPCLSLCQKGPNVQLQPEGKNWHGASCRDVEEIVAYTSAVINKTNGE